MTWFFSPAVTATAREDGAEVTRWFAAIHRMCATLALMIVALWLGLGPLVLLAAVGGMVTAVVFQRLQLAWFASSIRRAEASDWMNRIPASMASLRKPLAEVENQIERRVVALKDATAREQLRDVVIDALEMEVDNLDRALGDARVEMAEVLASLDRALASPSPQACLRRELVEVRELVGLNVYAELPSDHVALDDVVADVVEGGLPRGRVVVTQALPVVTAPSPLLEAMVRAGLEAAMAATEDRVEVEGTIDGAMVVLSLSGLSCPDASIHQVLARRAATILGGDVAYRGGMQIFVIPQTFVPGVRAIEASSIDWDHTAAIS